MARSIEGGGGGGGRKNPTWHATSKKKTHGFVTRGREAGWYEHRKGDKGLKGKGGEVAM